MTDVPIRNDREGDDPTPEERGVSGPEIAGAAPAPGGGIGMPGEGIPGAGARSIREDSSTREEETDSADAGHDPGDRRA